MGDESEINTALRDARSSEGSTDFDRRRIQLLAKFFACGRAVIERIPIALAVAAETRKKLGPGYWIWVESGGNAGATFTPKAARENHAEHYNFPLTTGLVFPGEFEEGIIRIPTGLAGTLNLWVARFPVPLPNVQTVTGLPAITGTVGVTPPAPLIMAPPAAAPVTAASTVVALANPARRFIAIENTDAVNVVFFAWDAVPVVGSGLVLQPKSGKSFGPNDLDRIPIGELRGIAAVAGPTNIAVQEGT